MRMMALLEGDRTMPSRVTCDAARRLMAVIDVAGSGRKAAELLDVDPAQTTRWARGETQPAAEHARMIVDLDHVMAHTLLVWEPEVARTTG